MKTKFESFGVVFVMFVALTLPFSSAHAQGAGELFGYMDNSLAEPAELDYQGLLAKAEKDGAVCVIVKLIAPSQLEASLAGAEALKNQRDAIAETQEKVLNDLTGFNIRSVKRFKTVPFIAMEVDAEALEFLHGLPEVAGIGEDIKVPASVIESIPLIGADQAQASGFSGAGQIVAILDTGVDKNHPFLQGKVVAEACFSTTSGDGAVTSVCPDGALAVEGDGAAAPCLANGCEHGTHVAGIAAGSVGNASGVARDASIVAIQVFSQVNDQTLCSRDRLSAPCTTTFGSDLGRALEYVYLLKTERDLDIAAANLSLGNGHFQSNCDADPNVSNDAKNQMVMMNVEQLYSAGIATIAASGNSGIQSDNFGNSIHVPGIGFPACLSKVISVGNTTKTDEVNPSSQSDHSLDLLAPGTDIVSSVPGAYDIKTGTSMAAPHVTGAWVVLKAQKPDASIPEILYALRNTGPQIDDARNGVTTPRVQVDGALQFQADVSYRPLDQLSPVEATIDETPAYQWAAVPDAERYYLLVADSSNNIVAEGSLEPGDAGCVSGRVCAIVVPNLTFNVGQYYWWVAAIQGDGHEWSRGVSFERR